MERDCRIVCREIIIIHYKFIKTPPVQCMGRRGIYEWRVQVVSVTHHLDFYLSNIFFKDCHYICS